MSLACTLMVTVEPQPFPIFAFQEQDEWLLCPLLRYCHLVYPQGANAMGLPDTAPESSKLGVQTNLSSGYVNCHQVFQYSDRELTKPTLPLADVTAPPWGAHWKCKLLISYCPAQEDGRVFRTEWGNILHRHFIQGPFHRYIMNHHTTFHLRYFTV